MMLTLDSLRAKCSKGEQFEYLFFWGHQKSKNGVISKSCFSQWYDAGFTIEGIFYPSAEHWMMASKARLFGDEQILKEVLTASDPGAAKKLGRKVKGFDNLTWKKHARQIVTEGNVAKFSQNSELKDYLKSTGETVLVEASPYDRIWGIGLKADDERAKHPNTWHGQNLLGFALMDARTEIQ